MYKILIWGTGETYNDYLNLIRYEEMKGSFEVVAITSNENYIWKYLDGYQFVPKNELSECEYDFCLVAMKKCTIEEIRNEASELGIPIEKIIPARVLGIPYFDFNKYINLKKSNLSIICSNCWAGVVYHYLGLEFMSPTINMFFRVEQFNKFAGDLNYYLRQPVRYKCMRFNQELHINYPVGLIDDIELHFNHTTDFELAVKLWNRRKQRVNYDNLLIVSYSEFDEEVVKEFEQLDFKSKIIFTALQTKIPSAVRLNANDNGGIPMLATAWGNIPMFDLLELAVHGENYIRIK